MSHNRSAQFSRHERQIMEVIYQHGEMSSPPIALWLAGLWFDLALKSVVLLGLGLLVAAACRRTSAAAIAHPESPASTATLTVDAAAGLFTSIPVAVEAAAPHPRIEVHPGTYAGTIRITKPLTLRGTGAGDAASSRRRARAGPARTSSASSRPGCGRRTPLSTASPWPLQPEEQTIIPDGPPRDFRVWKSPGT